MIRIVISESGVRKWFIRIHCIPPRLSLIPFDLQKSHFFSGSLTTHWEIAATEEIFQHKQSFCLVIIYFRENVTSAANEVTRRVVPVGTSSLEIILPDSLNSSRRVSLTSSNALKVLAVAVYMWVLHVIIDGH